MTSVPDLAVATERVDDIPVLLTLWQQLDLPALLDAHLPTHGNWRGLSLGWVTTVWLTHLLSQADHRLNQVQDWAARVLHTLRTLTAQPTVRALDFTDDRLAAILGYLADDARWAALESALTARLLRVYDLQPQRVRLDLTTALSYATITPDGLLQLGHSKDGRPDLPQLKVALATLDPLALPLASLVLPGQAADDPHYAPLIAAVRTSIPQPGLLYVGDCKMAALATRALLAAGQDYYLCPLSSRQVLPTELQTAVDAVAAGTQPVEEIARPDAKGRPVAVAYGFERVVEQRQGAGRPWAERQLYLRSLAFSAVEETALRRRLTRAQAEACEVAVRRQGKPRLDTVAEVEAAVRQLLAHYGVGDLLTWRVVSEPVERRVRGYGGRRARVERTTQYRVEVAENPAVVKATVARLGWRVYVTNQPTAELSLGQAVAAYREEYLIEAQFGRLKGAPLSLSPLYVQRDAQRVGLVRLLSLALRGLSVLEYQVRRALQEQGGEVSGLSAGQPTRRSSTPRAEQILHAFQPITLSRIQLGNAEYMHLTPLTALQQQLLALLGWAPQVYESLVAQSAKPP